MMTNPIHVVCISVYDLPGHLDYLDELVIHITNQDEQHGMYVYPLSKSMYQLALVYNNTA